ncbi:MAG: acetolactate synthase [Rhodospirillaceae bacterium]|nr:acetolactate synthase [Rhodospirillaceae bacterium]
MKASDLFVKCLENEGVTHIFGIPGEENADVMISLMNSKIKFVLCRHEQAAAFMADVYGRLTGKAGVCLGTLGPGATNLVTGVADANMDRAPLVCLIGQADTERLHKESHQNMDSIAMFKPITKWAQSVYHPDNIPEIVRKAFKVAETEKPGAVLIELPEDIAEHKTIEKPIKPYVTRRPGADHKAVAKAVDIIMRAKNPLILAGNGAVRKRASEQLRRFAELTGIGVVNTFMGKGAIPRSDQHSLFTVGLQGKDHIIAAMREADVIISAGYDLVEYAPAFWNAGSKKKIIHIDFWPAEVDDHYQPAVDVAGDIADALWQMNEELTKRTEKRNIPLPLFDIKKRAALRKTISSDLQKEKRSKAFPMKPQKVLYDVREFLGPDDILLSDVGAHKMWISRYYQCDKPNTCLISNGFCTMGFAFPGSIGAKIACPDKKVLSINGYAGFHMNAQDIETAVRYKLNVVALVWMDGEYGLIKWKQQNSFNGRHSDLKFTNPNIELWAKSFGAWGKTLKSSDELLPALKTAYKQDGPAVIAIPIDYRENMKLSARLGKIEFPI